MHNAAIHETCLFKLVILVAGIVVGMFLMTVLMALIFMPNQLMMSIPTGDVRFLLPLTLSTVCSVIVLAFYARSHRSRFKS